MLKPVLRNAAIVLIAWTGLDSMHAGGILSHRPARPLPEPSDRPMGEGPARFVDGERGDDGNDGSKDKPWRTIRRSVMRLNAGDTLYLRGGVYYEQVSFSNLYFAVTGAEGKPITVRSYPNELVVIDGGFREFAERPEECWEPAPDGVEGECRSTRTYPNISRALGHFADSMIPLHSYRSIADLRAQTEAVTRVKGKRQPFYFGPGLWYDGGTGRIHVRLSHTHIRAFAPNNYRGETDPRKLPLVIAGYNSRPLRMEGTRHFRLQDVVIRGGGANTVLIRQAEDLEFDGVTLYSGHRGIRVETTGGLRVTNTALRGHMPPWGSRTTSKYLTLDSHLFVPVGTYDVRKGKRKYLSPPCRDFEIAYCEFTDGHDGPYLGGVKRLKFHHNLVDNMNDDGLYLSSWGPPGEEVHIYQNWLSRCLSVFAFGLGRGSESEPGSGVHIHRNVIDLRGPVPYQHPGPESPTPVANTARLCGDHGGPLWEPMMIYHNTILSQKQGWRGYYGFGWGGHLGGPKRRVFNNLFCQSEGLPGLHFSGGDCDFQADGNLHWGVREGPLWKGDFFAKFRQSRAFEESKEQYPPGWGANDLFTDPKFIDLRENWGEMSNLGLRKDSPAIDTGGTIPLEWPDPLRESDKDKPDIGAFPHGHQPWTVGVRGRIPICRGN